MEEIRDARLSDLDALTGLLALLFAQEKEFSPERELQREGLSKIVTTPSSGAILVAVREGQIVGMVNILYTISTALGSRVALLEDLVVWPQLRGCGLGTALVEAAVERCRREGCRRITLLTDHENHAAHGFYQQQGFDRSQMVVYRRLLAVD